MIVNDAAVVVGVGVDVDAEFRASAEDPLPQWWSTSNCGSEACGSVGNCPGCVGTASMIDRSI